MAQVVDARKKKKIYVLTVVAEINSLTLGLLEEGNICIYTSMYISKTLPYFSERFFEKCKS